jgi:hypothetical protein
MDKYILYEVQCEMTYIYTCCDITAVPKKSMGATERRPSKPLSSRLNTFSDRPTIVSGLCPYKAALLLRFGS